MTDDMKEMLYKVGGMGDPKGRYPRIEEDDDTQVYKKPWVNLTVDELIDLERKHLSHENLTRAIEAKLREKNA